MDEEITLKTRIIDFFLDIFDILSFLIFVLWIVLFIRFFVANPYTVVGASMSPTFQESDFIIVDKISQRLDNINRWDVIVFVPEGKTIPYIKRVVWMSWETVKIQNWGVIICDVEGVCNELEEKYISEDLRTNARCGIKEFKINTWYFVLWDNRWFSTDSLCCFGLGCYDWASYEVLDENIIWKVLFRVFPDFGASFYG